MEKKIKLKDVIWLVDGEVEIVNTDVNVWCNERTMFGGYATNFEVCKTAPNADCMNVMLIFSSCGKTVIELTNKDEW